VIDASAPLVQINYSVYLKNIVNSKPCDDIVVQKKECMGRVQNRWLRALKKNIKDLGGKGNSLAN